MAPHSTVVGACASSDSLDITKIVSQAHNHTESLLNASITFLSLTDSARSLDSSPSFPSISNKPMLVALSPGNTLFDRINRPTERLTIPTVPRLKRIIKEPIAVARWAETVTSPLEGREPWTNTEDESVSRIRWAPSGSIFSPEAFRAALRKCRLPNSESWTLVVQTAMDHEDNFLDRSDVDLTSSFIANVSTCIDNSTRGDMVPTIMLSNSTAAMPLSLESAQSVSQLASAPLALAARRGRTGPPPIPLPSLPVPASDLYPGIPTPFRGSPSAYSPKFEFSDPTSDFSMDLEAMCQDLRLRCPPLAPPSPMFDIRTDPLTNTTPVLASSTSSGSDEWDFARELLETHIERPLSSSAGHTPFRPTPSEPTECASPEFGTPNSSSDTSWGTDPTLTNSPQLGQQLPSVLEEEELKPIKPVVASELPKQQRRRTVIIETPRNSVVGAARPVRMTVDLSHLADEDACAPESATKEIPFERPAPAAPTTASDVQNIRESHIRPISSASMGRPVRSILKTREKKSVRFSELPDTREYTGERELESIFEVDGSDDGAVQDMTRENTKCNGGRKRAATTPGFKSRRKSAAAETNGAEMGQSKQAGFPKHPAVRSLVRSSNPIQSTSPTPIVKGGKPGHQSMQVDRNIDKAQIGRPRRLTGVPSARSSLPADAGNAKSSLRKKQSKDENSWRKSTFGSPSEKSPDRPMSVQKSRMPFKSILTKLRS